MLTLHFQMRDSEIVITLSTFSFHKEDKCNLNGLVWACAALYFRTHGNEGRLFVILYKSDLSCQQLTESQNQICVSLSVLFYSSSYLNSNHEGSLHVSFDCNRALVTKNNGVGEIPFMWLRWWLAEESKIQVLFRSAEHPSSSRGTPLLVCCDWRLLQF